MATSKKSEIWTIPNGLTAIRALGVPIFLYLLLAKDLIGWSFFVLVLGACTDYLDGKVARWLNQESKLGAAMDPTIDRIYIAATVIALAIKGFIPWWLVIILAIRDLYMLCLVGLYRKRSGQVFEVTFLGKTATFNLLYAFPFLLLNSGATLGKIEHVVGWSFALWGLGLYLVTAVDYTETALRAPRRIHEKLVDPNR
jgi:cardiolipin synthase